MGEMNDTYQFELNADGTVTAYHYSKLPEVYPNLSGIVGAGEKVAVAFANAELRVVPDGHGTLFVTTRMPSLEPMTLASESTSTPPGAPPPKRWFRTAGER